jgi:CRISPR-associated protein Csx3
MLNKISSMLDAVADSLEARGLIKEAYEIDRITDKIAAEDLISFKMTLEKDGDADLLRIGFGSPAQNDKILKDVVKLLDDLVKNKLKGGKLLKINGPASLPVAMHLAHSVGHIYGATACYDPKLNKYVVSISHDPDFEIGSLID